MKTNQALTLIGDKEFIDKIFGYAYRRCNTSHEAEDLASDIILAVIGAIGNRPISTISTHLSGRSLTAFTPITVIKGTKLLSFQATKTPTFRYPAPKTTSTISSNGKRRRNCFQKSRGKYPFLPRSTATLWSCSISTSSR